MSLRVTHNAAREAWRRKQGAPGFRVSRCSPGMTDVSSSSFQSKLESRGVIRVGHFVSEQPTLALVLPLLTRLLEYLRSQWSV
jgi:hypothetical protein